MTRIKSSCEDFIVTEILLEGYIHDKPTKIHVYLMEKRNYTTERAVAHIARALSIPRKNIAYAGTKDKNAVTSQYITIRGASKEKAASLSLKDISLHFKGYADEPLRLGMLAGNHFRIVVRDVPSSWEFPSVPEKRCVIPAYFDEQRFSRANHEIGFWIVRKEFKKAVDIIKSTDDDHKEAIEEHLKHRPNDFVGALKLLPRKTLFFYVHALQSKLFNAFLRERVAAESADTTVLEYSFGNLLIPDNDFFRRDDLLQEELPLPGYDSELTELQEIWLEKEGLKQSDFLIRQIPELSLEGSVRPVAVEATDLDISMLDSHDDKHDDKKDILLSFSLPKAAYATIVMKTILSGILATAQSD